MNMSTMNEAIKIAYQKGYRVTDDGILIGINGPIAVKSTASKKYPAFSVSGVPGIPNKYGVFGIPVHKFAAFCFFGDASFRSECVRHLNGNVEDVSRTNIALGTNKENEADKDPAVRSAVAKKARAAQGYRAHNSKFSDDQIRFIREEAKTRSQKSLADQFGVTRACINMILKRKNYSDVS